ncbi:hypothetical protein LTR84_013072 [Exophiala bonariae]|uniref:Peptidase A2 domain-containing protein n=1 Tax=Exophiala bonariae TaxID=1690606 RepID=A0AAV9NDR8_9EURO|nr:hypothetical protein LTR84_013072 [Exophiala bonariae]
MPQDLPFEVRTSTQPLNECTRGVLLRQNRDVRSLDFLSLDASVFQSVHRPPHSKDSRSLPGLCPQDVHSRDRPFSRHVHHQHALDSKDDSPLKQGLYHKDIHCPEAGYSNNDTYGYNTQCTEDFYPPHGQCSVDLQSQDACHYNHGRKFEETPSGLPWSASITCSSKDSQEKQYNSRVFFWFSNVKLMWRRLMDSGIFLVKSDITVCVSVSHPGSSITACISLPRAEDSNKFRKQMMVEVNGERTWLATAQLDTGSAPSFMSETIAKQAQNYELTTVKPGTVTPYEGLAQGHKVDVVGQMELRFWLKNENKPYKHQFLVVKADDRFDVLLGAKFLERADLQSWTD